MILPTVVEWSHWIISHVLRPGDVAFDATVGRGNDLLMMASLVGDEGCVLGCDIQERAIESARHNAEMHGVRNRVRLHVESHEYIDRICHAENVAQLRAIMYNLGYLPGGDKSIRTLAERTIASLKKALDLLMLGGTMTIVSYRGHEGGAGEAQAVLEWCKTLPPYQFEVVMYNAPVAESSPIGIAVGRRLIRCESRTDRAAHR